MILYEYLKSLKFQWQLNSRASAIFTRKFDRSLKVILEISQLRSNFHSTVY